MRNFSIPVQRTFWIPDSQTFYFLVDKLLKRGEGQIEIAAYDEAREVSTVNPEIVMADPMQGFSIVLSDQTLPINMNGWSFYLGIDGRGRLNTAMLSNTWFWNLYNDMAEKYGSDDTDQTIVYDSINMIYSAVGHIQNICMRNGDINRACGQPSVPGVFRTFTAPIREEFQKYFDGLRDKLFTVVR